MSISKSKIINIIFDLGGVIINIDYSLLVKAFRHIGLPHFEAYFSQQEQKELFDLYEKGLISSAEFRKELKIHCQPNTSDDDIDAAWNSMLLDLPKERLDLLLKLKQTYRTFLLSNTNEIHMIFIYKYLAETFKINNFKEHFEKIYLSFEIQMRKPDMEIFKLVLAENKLIAEETMFIDDSIQHVESAKKVGIQAVYLDLQKQTLNDLFAT